MTGESFFGTGAIGGARRTVVSFPKDFMCSKQYQCDICFEGYDRGERTPMILSCGHSLCNKCLNNLFQPQHGQIQCPFDKKKNRYPGGIEEVGKNFSLLSLIEVELSKPLAPIAETLAKGTSEGG